MTIAKLTGCILPPCFLLMPLYSVGQETTSTIEQQASIFLQSHYSEHFSNAQIKINITPVKARFQNYSCTAPVQFTPPRNLTSKPLLKATCIQKNTAQPEWTLYLRSHVSVQKNALALRARIDRGQRIDSSMLEIRMINLIKYPESFSSQIDLEGMVASRSIPAGHILSRKDVTLAPAISKGDAIIIEARRNGLTIRTTGTAQQSGHIGKQIRAINNRSGKEIRGIIKSRGLIVVT